MPKGRIGLSLSEDVMAILKEHGRMTPGDDPNLTPSQNVDRWRAYWSDKRPTRTLIIEDALRLWSTQPDLRTIGRTDVQANGGQVKEVQETESDPESIYRSSRRPKVKRTAVPALADQADVFCGDCGNLLSGGNGHDFGCRTAAKGDTNTRRFTPDEIATARGLIDDEPEVDVLLSFLSARAVGVDDRPPLILPRGLGPLRAAVRETLGDDVDRQLAGEAEDPDPTLAEERWRRGEPDADPLAELKRRGTVSEAKASTDLDAGAGRTYSEEDLTAAIRTTGVFTGGGDAETAAKEERQVLGTGETVPEPKPGWSRWIENGTWFSAPIVDPERFGGHAYEEGFGRGVRDCPCGCFMLSSSSGGPVDPFGACPKNPKQAAQQPEVAAKKVARKGRKAKLGSCIHGNSCIHGKSVGACCFVTVETEPDPESIYRSSRRPKGGKALRGNQAWPCPGCDGRKTDQIYASAGVHTCMSCGGEVLRPAEAALQTAVGEALPAKREPCDDGLCLRVECPRCNPNNEPGWDGYMMPPKADEGGAVEKHQAICPHPARERRGKKCLACGVRL